MPEYLSPGVYVEEIEIGGKPIEGVSTSTAAFLGQTERGPVAPQLITGFGEYQRVYGELAWSAPGEKKSDTEVKSAVESAKKAEADAVKKEEAAKNAAPEKKVEAEKAAAEARK